MKGEREGTVYPEKAMEERSQPTRPASLAFWAICSPRAKRSPAGLYRPRSIRHRVLAIPDGETSLLRAA